MFHSKTLRNSSLSLVVVASVGSLGSQGLHRSVEFWETFFYNMTFADILGIGSECPSYTLKE